MIHSLNRSNPFSCCQKSNRNKLRLENCHLRSIGRLVKKLKFKKGLIFPWYKSQSQAVYWFHCLRILLLFRWQIITICSNHQLLKLHQDLVHLSRILTWNWVTMAPHQFYIKGYLAAQKELRSVELVSTKISNLTASQLLWCIMVVTWIPHH